MKQMDSINDLISIVIPNYNGLHYLRNCLESVFLLEYSNFELIIVDNGSSDGSVEWLESNYKSKYILISNTKNLGFAKAVNQGILASRGTFVALLNNDTVVKPQWLTALVKTLRKDERIFSVSSRMMRYHEPEIIDDAGDGYTIMGWAYKIGDGEHFSKHMKDKEIFSACAGAALYRKNIFDQIGLFDESFFAYLEDVDIGFRARRHGYINWYSAGAEVLHIGSGTSGSKYNAFKANLSSRNNLWVIYKNMPVSLKMVNIIPILVGVIAKGIFFLVKGLGKSFFLGGIAAFQNNFHKEKIHTKRINSWQLEKLILIDTANYIKCKLWTK